MDFLHGRRTINIFIIARSKRRRVPMTIRDNIQLHLLNKLSKLLDVRHTAQTCRLVTIIYFGPLRELLGRKQFENDIQVDGFGCNWFLNQPATFYKTGIETLRLRQQEYLESKRRYVENILVINLFFKSPFHY